MKQNKIKLMVLLLLVMEFARIQAQEATITAGGNTLGSGGSISYTIGQVAYTTNTGANGSVADGVQQPYEIAVVTGLYEAKVITLQFLVYPNPVTDILILRINGEFSSKYAVSLYDTKGRCLEVKKIIDNETIIDTKNRVPAAYFLKVTDDNIVVKTFKIIKNE